MPRVRRPAPRRLPRAGAGHDRPRRRRALEPPGRHRPATCPARTSSSTPSTPPRSERPRLRTAARARPRRPRAGPGGRAGGDRLRRLRVPVLRGARGAAARARAARDVPALPGALEPPARAGGRARRRGGRRCRARSGRSTTRCSPTRGAWRTRTCGRAPRALGLDLARFDADRRSDAVAERVREDFRGGIRAGVATTPTLFADGVRHAGPARPGAVGRAAPGLTRARTAVRLAPYTPALPWPPATSSSSSACAPTRPARRCAPSTGPTRASCTASR